MSIIEGSKYVFLGSAILMIISVFTSILIIRTIGNENYGVIALIIEIIMLCKFFITEWMAPGTTFFISKYYKEKEEIISSVLFFTLLLILLAATLLYFSADFIAKMYKIEHLSNLIKIASFFAVFFCIQPIISGIFLGLKKYWYSLVRETLVGTIKLLSLMLAFSFGFYGAFIGYINFYTLSTLLGVFYLVSKKLFKKPNFSKFKKILSYSKNIFISKLSTYFSRRLGIIILGFKSASSVTFFSMSLSITSMSSIVANSISLVLLPEISSMRKKKIIKNTSQRIFKYSLLITLPVASCLILLHDPIATIIFKNSSTEARATLVIACLQFVFGNLILIASSLANALNKTFLTKNTYVMASLINTLFLLILSKYRAIGASVALLFSSIFSFLYICIKLKKFLIWDNMKKSICKSLIAVLIAFLITSRITFIIYEFSGLIKVIILGAISAFYFTIYIISLFFMKEIGNEEILIFKKLVSIK